MTMHTVRGGLLAAVSIIAFGYGLLPAIQPAAAQSAKPAVLTSKGAWNANATYAVDDVVTLRGTTWRSKVAGNKNHLPGSTNPNNASFWEALAVGFNPRGNWSAAVTYQPNELVVSGGQTWRAKLTVAASNTAPVAGANWELLVTKGAAGPNTGIGLGSQSVPSISFNGDPNTGIYSPGADQIALVEGGKLFLHNLGTNNSAFGFTALASNTSGASNTAIGSAALNKNTIGTNNVAVGTNALFNNIGGVNNIAIGTGVLFPSTGGADNVGIGILALGSSTTASKNVAIGRDAMFTNETGENNVAIGYQALKYSTTADNTAVGFLSLNAQTNGANNTAVGSYALTSVVSGQDNTAVGRNALAGNLSNNNSAVGAQAMQVNQSGAQNTAFGAIALANNLDGSDNLAVGYGALYANQSGGSNTAIGRSALLLATGSGNIALGQGAGSAVTTSNDSILIGNTGTSNDNKTIKIGTIGATDTQTSTFIAGVKGVDAGAFTNSLPVYIDTDTGQLAALAPSSRRMKDEIAPMNDVTGMLDRLRPVTFRYKKPQNNGDRPLHYGLIAEEVAEVMPYLAAYNADGSVRTVHYDRLPSFLLAGWQAHQKTIAAQAEKIASQGDEIALLKERLAAIEAVLPRVTKAALQ